MQSTHLTTLPIFLVIHHTTTSVEVGLFEVTPLGSPRQLIASTELHYHATSAQLIPTIQQQLAQAHLALSDLHACAVNVGPGPFTTLRTIIATVNGIAYARPLPLIAVNGLTAFLHEQEENLFEHTVAALNAFGNDCYVGWLEHKTKNIRTVVCTKKSFSPEQPLSVFNTAEFSRLLRPAERVKLLGLHAPTGPQSASPSGIAHEATRLWNQNVGIVKQLEPIYFKPYLPGT